MPKFGDFFYLSQIASFHLLFNFGGVGGSMIMHEVIDSRAERSCPGANLTKVSNRAPLTEDKFPLAFFIPAALHIPVILLLIFIKVQKSLEKLKQESTFEISTITSIHEVDSDLSDGSSKVSYTFYVKLERLKRRNF